MTGPQVQEVPSSPSTEQILSEWRAWLAPSVSSETVRMYTWRVGYLLKLTRKHPVDITVEDLREHLSPPRCRAANTQTSAMNAFRSFFRFLTLDGYRSDDPSRSTRIPKAKPPPTIPRYLTVHEAAALDEAASWEGVQLHALCRVFLYQGLRASEGCRLAWKEPTRFEDPEGICSGVIDLREGWILVKGKGRKERELPIHPKAREALKLAYKYRRHDTWAFPRRAAVNGEILPMTRSGVHIAVKRWARAAKLDERRVSAHKLRHTFATNYLAAGADITYVQAALGHSRIQQTMVYARVRKEDLQRTMKRVKY